MARQQLVVRPRATVDEIARAKIAYTLNDNNIEIDGDAEASYSEDGVWVQAWVWLGEEREDMIEDI